MAVVRKIQVKVIEIESFSYTVKRYRLAPQKTGIRFKPGQFLHLAIDAYDPSTNWPDSRVFSIANSPTRTEYIDVFVSKIGEFTSKMFQSVKVGDEVWIKLPYGTFNFDESINKDTVLIAGGTGISPFISFLQYAVDNKLNPAIHLNYGVRKTDMLIIQDLVKEAKQKLANFNYNIYIEEEISANFGLHLKSGQLPVSKIVDESLSLNQAVYYLSGPPAMITAFDKELKAKGVDKQYIKYDNWE